MDSDCSSYFSTEDSPSQSETAEKTVPEISEDDQFYFTLVTFKVEDRLFRVPKHELEEQSHVFRDMFSMPPAKDSRDVEGMSDDNPIHLEAISKEEFKLLLKLIYLPKAKDISSTLTVEQCTSLLKLSHMWDFENVNLIAKRRIRYVLWDEISAVDKIKLAHDYQLEDWYADAYYELATRKEPLSVEEAQRLGLEFSIAMAQVREKVSAVKIFSKGEMARVAQDAIGEIFHLVDFTESVLAQAQDVWHFPPSPQPPSPSHAPSEQTDSPPLAPIQLVSS